MLTEIPFPDDPDMPLSGYLSLLRPGGNFILVGAPEKPLPQITPFELIPKHVSLGGTMIVSRRIPSGLRRDAKPFLAGIPFSNQRDAGSCRNTGHSPVDHQAADEGSQPGSARHA
jgi:hypothetical protein